jgi:hypothetical protein
MSRRNFGGALANSQKGCKDVGREASAAIRRYSWTTTGFFQAAFAAHLGPNMDSEAASAAMAFERTNKLSDNACKAARKFLNTEAHQNPPLHYRKPAPKLPAPAETVPRELEAA